MNLFMLSQVVMYCRGEAGCGMRFGAFGLLLGGFRSLQRETSQINHLCILPAQTGSQEPAALLRSFLGKVCR